MPVMLEVSIRENATPKLKKAARKLRRDIKMWGENAARNMNSDLRKSFKERQRAGPRKTLDTFAWETEQLLSTGNPLITLNFTGSLERRIMKGPFSAQFEGANSTSVTFDGYSLPYYSFFHEFDSVTNTAFGTPGQRAEIPARPFFEDSLNVSIKRSEQELVRTVGVVAKEFNTRPMSYRYFGSPRMWAFALVPPSVGLQYLGMFSDWESAAQGSFTSQHVKLFIEAMILAYIGIGKKMRRRQLRRKIYSGR